MTQSTTALIQPLAKLLKLHRSLADLADRKTDIIKKGDMEALNLLVKEEAKAVQAIKSADAEREQAAAAFSAGENLSLNDILGRASGKEREQLEGLHAALSETLHMLKLKNDLNQELVQSSLDYVHLSLDLLRPQPEQTVYGRPDGKPQQNSQSGHSIFDSKA